eukprot:PhM_4_TR1275/c0_g1_i10/m.84720
MDYVGWQAVADLDIVSVIRREDKVATLRWRAHVKMHDRGNFVPKVFWDCSLATDTCIVTEGTGSYQCHGAEWGDKLTDDLVNCENGDFANLPGFEDIGLLFAGIGRILGESHSRPVKLVFD